MAKSILDIVIQIAKKGNADKDTVSGLVNIKKNVQAAAGAAALLTGAFAGAFAFLNKASAEAESTARTHAKLTAVLNSTGNAVGYEKSELDAMAVNMERLSGVHRDLITNSQAVMLTFTKIGHDIFPQAQQAAMDMAAVLGGDLQQSTIQVSKALNDFSGYTALKRAGVSFTEEQIKQIEGFKKTNDLASYQKLILKELASEFGGTAEAMNKMGGETNRLKNAWTNFLGAFGQKMNDSWFNDFKRGLSFSIERVTDWISGSQDMQDAADGSSVAIATATEALQQNAEAAQADEEAIKAASEAHKSMLGLIGSIANENKNYADKQAELTQKMQENRAEAEQLYPWQSKQLDELNQKYADMEQTYQQNAEAHTAAMNKIQYDLLVTKLSADGLTDSEYQIIQQAGLMFGVFDEQSVQQAQNMNMLADAVNNGTLNVQDLGAAINNLPAQKDINIVLNAMSVLSQQGGSGQIMAQAQHNLNPNNPRTGYADGGIATGPTSGHLELLHGTEAVIPLKNGSVPVQMSGGGGVNLNVIINAAMNIVDEQKIRALILPHVTQAFRDMKARGLA
jgi:hypothetical protein